MDKNNLNCLLGYSGYVGSTLLKQRSFDLLYNTSNIDSIKNQEFNICVCAAAPAQKWIANNKPVEDRENIQKLINNLNLIKCELFILISTVDVFVNPINVNEFTEINENGLHPYGLNRVYLENYVKDNFSNYLIIRLPGLVGPGLRKNIIYDFLNNNDIHKIDSRSLFQFYPMVNLWYDIQKAIDLKLNLVHFTAEPLSVNEIAMECFGISFNNSISISPVNYDFKTLYALEFGRTGEYQYSKSESIQAIRSYAQCEPTIKSLLK